MSTFPGSPRLIRGGLVLLDPQTSQVRRVIALQYNPDKLTRTLAPQVADEGHGHQHADALRLKGPPVETIKLEAEIDATDQLEAPDQNQAYTELGIGPVLAVLELIVYPESARLRTNDRMASAGQMSVLAGEGPLVLFVWSKSRVMPVRLTEFSIVEEAFDPGLNPIRAKVTLGMRVLTVADLGSNTKGGSVYMAYQQEKERLASRAQGAAITVLGIGGIP